MQMVSKRMQRRALRGWLRWSLVVIVGFSPLYVDAWLNVKMRHHDYIINQLNSERNHLNNELISLTVNRASLERMDRLSMNAEALALREPDPNQVHVIYYDGRINSVNQGQGRMLMAQRSATRDQETAIQHQEDGLAGVVHHLLVRGTTIFQQVETSLTNLLDSPLKVEASELHREYENGSKLYPLEATQEFSSLEATEPMNNRVDLSKSLTDKPLEPEVPVSGNQDVLFDTLQAPLDAIIEMPREPIFSNTTPTHVEQSLDDSIDDLLGSF